jgi:hypothetical protein
MENNKEIEHRKKVATDAIKKAFGTKEDEYGTTLFVSNHREQIDQSYWEKHTGKTDPEPGLMLDILDLNSHWGDDYSDGMDTLDFTLPDGITDYVISVCFDEDGLVESIEMES